MEAFPHLSVQIGDQDLTAARRSNTQDLYYFFEHYFMYMFIPLSLLIMNQMLGQIYTDQKNLNVDILDWSYLYRSRNL